AAAKPDMAKPAAADSAARVRWVACADSVTGALQKTVEGKNKLATQPPEGMIRPEFLSACGKPPAGALAATAGPQPETAAAAPAPVGTAQAALTPKQLQVLHADSVRKAREQTKADSLKHLAETSRADSIKRSAQDSIRNDSLKLAKETEVLRETFTYSGGPRDPFVSLLTSAKVGPEFADLLLLGIYQDLRYASNSIAVLRDRNSGKRYKLRVGDQVGRLKVAQIRQRDVVFTVEDFGFERQETLSLRKREADTP
ncbi:MAG: hypothetical protein ACREMO_02370, partial [Gemmatimonadales bacterium]